MGSAKVIDHRPAFAGARSGEIVAFLRFEGQAQEISSIQLIRHRYPDLVEPGAEPVSGSFVLSDDALAEVPASR